jgi:hypothetical protein
MRLVQLHGLLVDGAVALLEAFAISRWIAYVQVSGFDS